MPNQTVLATKLLLFIVVSVLTALPLNASAGSGEAVAQENYAPPDNSAGWMPYINSGWGSAFNELDQVVDPNRNYITWIVKAPQYTMDFRSAEYFKRSMVTSVDRLKGSISHMMIAWQCHDSRGRRIRGATGMTGENSQQSKKMLRAGWGQTMFLSVFNDGTLNNPEDVDYVLNEAVQKRLPVGHVTFEVSQQDCNNMLTFLKRFLDHPNVPASRFGLTMDPLKFEGGGCGSFATAMLTKANFLPSIQPLMWRKVQGSRILMGGARELPPGVTFAGVPADILNTPKNVSIEKLQRLAWTGKDGPAIRVVDPEMSLYALRTILIDYMQSSGKNPADLKGSAYGQRTVKSINNLGESDETTYFKINDSFDGQTAQVRRSTLNELAKMKKRGYKGYSVKIGQYWGAMYTRAGAGR